MTSGERRGPTPGHLLAAVLLAILLLALVVRRGAAVLVPGGGSPRSDCLAQFDVDGVTAASSPSAVQCTEGDPCDHDGCGNNSCRFRVALCLNRSTSSCTAPAGGLKKVVPKGLLKRLGIAVPDLKSSVCPGAFLDVDVALKKNGKTKGKKTLALVAISTARPKKDSDAVTLTCLPRQGACSATTTTTVVSTTTTTTLRCGNGIIDADEQCDPPGTQAPQCPAGQACNAQCQCETVSCAPIVPGQPIPNTYTLLSVAGPKLCTPAAPEPLRFKPCQSDADCGGTICFPTPWVAVGPITQPTPVGVSTTFTVAAAVSPPSCQHAACIKCGNPSAACTPITGGCSDPSNDCKFGAQCCDDPGFVIPAIFIDLGIFKVCSLLNQLACGLGVVDTANPQTGDNEVMKVGDTSDPGPDCVYGTSDDPAAKSCDTAGAGNDTKGKVVRTVGDGKPDAQGIHFRLPTPGLSTTWTVQSQAECPANATFQTGQTLVSQLILSAEPSTAGAMGEFRDLNGDGCAHVGLGFTSAAPEGPIVVGPPGVQPAPYEGGESRNAAAGIVFSGASPVFDLGFTAITQTSAAQVVAPQTCTCTPTPGCPE